MPYSYQEPEYYTDLAVGEILRRTRLHYGQSLEQVEAMLRIRASQLDAIERGDLENLPGRVYTIGFVRSYSEYLGLDGDKMVHLFKNQSVGNKNKPELHFPVAASESKIPGIYTIAASLVGFVIVLTLISTFIMPEKPEEEVPPVPEELAQRMELEPTFNEIEVAGDVMGPLLPADMPASDLAAIEPAAVMPDEEIILEPEAPPQVVLEITENSWIEIRNAEGAAILRQILKPGDEYTVPDEEGLIMSTGNAGGITIKVGNQTLPPIGKSAEVRRDILLDPENLLNSTEN